MTLNCSKTSHLTKVIIVMEDIIKVFFGFIMTIVLIIAAVMAAPTIWEQTTSDKSTHPHSGATPECSSWDISLEEGLERAELMRQVRK